ncbi:insulinase family protein [Helcococcus sueciensis]|uniref:insulinase family protein n=1 Tax=Helcococcus sueciensis TaxID=241555 RepID=UPI000418197F|nr:insulinase family protein [Helcococcus sueciensis]
MQHFNLLEDRYLKNEQAQALVFEHIETKAKVFIMSNEDDNKLFGIGFRTPPKNSNGVCHIIEHAVLNGSKKYTTKEPFMDMIKGSLNTFLNAMTYSDKTIYPVASRNDKDFKNLTDVYLDAVFNPRARKDEKIFRQEGWRYNLEDDELTYKGVVYNEMRGAMSSQESQVYQNIYKELMPDTIYAFNSGGDPYIIPSLTYDDFNDFYDEFYHPSNSYIFLYGDMDYESYLECIHNEYLSNYEYRKIDSELIPQEKFNSTRYSVNYINTTKDVNPKDSFVSYSTIIGDARDSKIRILSEVLTQALIENESSPLRQKLLSSGILDVIISASGNQLESVFSIIAKNIDVDDRDKFVELIEDELKNIVETGIDKELILSELNNYKFQLREKGGYSTKGIVYFTMAFDSWLYDKSPIEAIDIEDDLTYIEENIDNGIFEKFIKENILESNHKSIVSHIPIKGLNDQKDEEVRKQLENLKNSLSEREKEEYIQRRIEMDDFQSRNNTDEEKATIPMLEKNDVSTKVEKIDREVLDMNDYTILKHNLPTSGIDYIDLAFDIDHITSPEDILYTSLLTGILGAIDTENYNFSDLNKKVLLNTGGIGFNMSQFNIYQKNEISRKLIMSTKIFTENIENSIEIIEEIINKTKFDNLDKIKEIILLIKASNEISLYQRAHVMMMNRAVSNHLPYMKYGEFINGVDFYQFIKEISDKDMKEVSEKLENVYNKVFNRKNLIINIGSTFENESLIPEIEKLASSIDYKEFIKTEFEFTPNKKHEGFKTSADVNYVSYGNKLNMEYNSKFTVLNNLVSTEYLYTEIRAKGGAYGSGMLTSINNNFATYSYRDPNLQRTIDIYNKIPEFLESIRVTEEDLLPYIIGAVGKIDPPRTERTKSFFDMSQFITGLTNETVEKMIVNALETDIVTLKLTTPKIKEMLDTASLAVLGNSQIIEINKDMFDEIIEL